MKNLDNFSKRKKYAFTNNLQANLDLRDCSFLWILILSYTIMLSYANWFCTRLISMHGIIIDAGNLVFPFTFIIASIITEVYGYKKHV